MAELVPLVSDLVHVLISSLLEHVEEPTLFQLVHALLQQLPWLLLPILAKAQLSLSLCDELCVREDRFYVQSLLGTCRACTLRCRHLHGCVLLLRSVLSRVRLFEEESVVVAQDEVIDLLLHALKSVLNQPFCLCTVCQVLTLTCSDIVRLLERARGLLLRFVLQQAPLEWLCWVEVDLLCHESLLIL